MDFKETETIHNLAVAFITGTLGVREGYTSWDPNSSMNDAANALKPLLPKTFTKESPYSVNIDGDTCCDIWFNVIGDLQCGTLYFDNGNAWGD